jgi:uncharacterized protein (DUF2252 family)
MDIVGEIRAFNANREAERLHIKYDHMRASSFAFFRGGCHLFYDQLPQGGIFKSAPLTWVCGDLHIENFGSYKGDNRLVYFDLNDFDEAALAPVSWELVRMLTSIRMWASGVGAPTKQEEALCASFLNTYATELAKGKSYWFERETATGLIQSLLDNLRTRNRAQFLNTRTTLKGKRRRLLTDGRRALPASPKQRLQVSEFMTAFAQTQAHPEFYKVLDIARRIAGTGSLGVERYAILVEGKGSPDHNYVLDMKQCLPASLAPFLKAAKFAQPKWQTQAERVVNIQHKMQAMPIAFLQAVTMGEQSYVLRGLQPSEDRVAFDFTRHSLSDIHGTLSDMGKLTAWAELRSAGHGGSANVDDLMAFAVRKKWRLKLLDISQDLSAQVKHDALLFNEAYDDHALID